MENCPPLTKLTPEELSYLATSIGAALARGLGNDSVAVLSSFFFGIGSTLGLIEKQRVLLETCCAAKKDT